MERDRISQVVAAQTRERIHFDERFMRDAISLFIARTAQQGIELHKLCQLEQDGALHDEGREYAEVLQTKIQDAFYECFGHEMKPRNHDAIPAMVNEAMAGVASEKLAGNAVKQSFWEGQLSALHQVLGEEEKNKAATNGDV